MFYIYIPCIIMINYEIIIMIIIAIIIIVR